MNENRNPNGRYKTNVEGAIAAIKAGRMIIMVDEADRENEGDLVMAAEFVSAEHINFMAKEARGLICLTLEPKLLDRLKLPMMADSTKTSPQQGTAFTVSIEAKSGVTTGISAADRAHTVRVAVHDNASPEDIVVPGHIFPLRAREGGILVRAGHTEGSVDIAKLAGLKGAGVICEIMNDDGTMARMPDLEAFAIKHDIPIVAISDLIKYRLHREPLVQELRRSTVQTSEGTFDATLFHNRITNQNYVALTKGDNFSENVVDVRVHSQRPLIDVFGMADSETGFRLHYGLRLLKQSERGVFLYLPSENPEDLIAEDFNLLNTDGEHHAPASQPPLKMDERMLGTGAQILRHLGVRQMRIHTTSNRNFVGLDGYGLEIIESHLMMPTQKQEGL